jgi:hypothetical protein
MNVDEPTWGTDGQNKKFTLQFIKDLLISRVDSVNPGTVLFAVDAKFYNYASCHQFPNIMKNKLQAALAFIGAPFLGIDFFRNIHSVDQWDVSVFTRVCDIMYMTGWICTMFALAEMKAAGSKRVGRNIIYTQISFLFIAGMSDVVSLFQIPIPPRIFFFWDLFWPLSNCMMLVTGVAIAAAGVLTGWKRWIPLFMGLWLPITIVVKSILPFEYVGIIGGAYSIVLWTIMAWVAFQPSKTVRLAFTAATKSRLTE